MCPIFHLLGEDVAGVALAHDVKDLEDLVLNPFPDRVVLEFHVAGLLHGEIVGPVHTGLVVIVDGGFIGGIGDGNACAFEVASHITNGHGEFGAFVSGANFGFAGALRSAFLAN